MEPSKNNYDENRELELSKRFTIDPNVAYETNPCVFYERIIVKDNPHGAEIYIARQKNDAQPFIKVLDVSKSSEKNATLNTAVEFAKAFQRGDLEQTIRDTYRKAIYLDNGVK